MSKLTTMKVACPDCGSEMLKRPDDFDFDTNFVGVSCANCGREITKDDVVKQGTDVVKSRLTTFSGCLQGNGLEAQVTPVVPRPD